MFNGDFANHTAPSTILCFSCPVFLKAETGLFDQTMVADQKWLAVYHA